VSPHSIPKIDEGANGDSHTCEHLLIAVKLPQSHPRNAAIPWDSHPTLRALRRGVDTDVVVAEVRSVAWRPNSVLKLIKSQRNEQEARRGVRRYRAVSNSLEVVAIGRRIDDR
jgi:hypothetical protein